MALWIDPRSIVLLAVPTAIVFVAYRAYMGEREKHERLELLYESSRLLHYAPELDSAIGALLDHARRMFRAERADLLLFPDPLLEAALRSSSGGSSGPETMVPVTVALDDPLRARTSHEARAFSALPGPGWTTSKRSGSPRARPLPRSWSSASATGSARAASRTSRRTGSSTRTSSFVSRSSSAASSRSPNHSVNSGTAAATSRHRWGSGPPCSRGSATTAGSTSSLRSLRRGAPCG